MTFFFYPFFTFSFLQLLRNESSQKGAFEKAARIEICTGTLTGRIAGSARFLIRRRTNSNASTVAAANSRNPTPRPTPKPIAKL